MLGTVYNWVILGLTSLIQFAVVGLTIWLLKNVKTEAGMLIEHSLNKFQTVEGLEAALRSNDIAQQRAGKIKKELEDLWQVFYCTYKKSGSDFQ